MSNPRPWPPGSVTGIGSLPGTDEREAVTLVLGELADLPHLPELPDRGPGADMIGRSAALLVELPVEIVSSGWRIAAHPGRDQRLAADFLARDLDAVEELANGYTGPLKVQAVGPWTLAAALELPNGHRVISDHGAVRDLTASLAAGLRVHLDDVATRVPGAELVLQLDEPSLPAVLGGQVPTPSGYGTVRSVDPAVVRQGLHDVLQIAPEAGRVVHCCDPDVPVPLLCEAGASAVSVDAALLGPDRYDALGEAVEAGVSLWLGVVPTTGEQVTLEHSRGSVHRLWSELGFARDRLAADVVPTPACGLAGASPEAVRRALRVLRDTGRSLLDES